MKNQFNEFVRKLCTKFSREIAATKGFQKDGFSMEKLCEGLCSPKTLRNLQNGNRNLDKLLQDEILGRLGIAAEDYNYLLDYDEYCRWEARQQILHNITWNRPKEAQQLLEDYQAHYNMGNRLERQFVVSMEAQIQYLLGAGNSADQIGLSAHTSTIPIGADRKKLSALFKEAVNLTVSPSAEDRLADMMLSVRELNLILESERCRDDNGRPERYKEIVDYLEESGWDRRGMGKLYPKAVYFFCESVMRKEDLEKGGQWSRQDLLRYCNHAIEILRDNERMYYLWELLNMRERLLEEIGQELAGMGKQGKAESLQNMRRETREYLQVLEKAYSEFQVPIETFHYCYLYVVNGVNCVNDVIRCRRKMLGMSRRELYENICSEKTLGRLERRETSMQKEIAAMLLERLGLSREFTRTELVTNNPEARAIMERLRYYANRDRWDEVDSLRKKIETLIDMEVVHNRQALKRCEILVLWEQKKIDDEEYSKQMKKVLEMTMPFELFLEEGEKYLTDEEQSCIQNMMEVMDKDSKEYLISLQRFEEIYHSYTDKELLESVSGMYEFIMGYVGSEYGNRGDYDRADKYSSMICQGCLWLRRMPELAYSLYDRWWNDKERKHKGIPAKHDLDDKEELTRCIIISKLNRQNTRERFCQKILNELKCKEK